MTVSTNIKLILIIDGDGEDCMMLQININIGSIWEHFNFK